MLFFAVLEYLAVYTQGGLFPSIVVKRQGMKTKQYAHVSQNVLYFSLLLKIYIYIIAINFKSDYQTYTFSYLGTSDVRDH